MATKQTDIVTPDDFNLVDLGEFKVTSGKLYVTDPCYTRGTWCQGLLKNVMKGAWHAFVVRQSYGGWGVRNWKLRIAHFGYLARECSLKLDVVIGVDSGQAGFFDVASYPKGPIGEFGDLTTFYGLVCSKTYPTTAPELMDSHPDAGVLPFGVVSSSGIGDGSYACYLALDAGQVVAAELIFLTEENTDEVD